MSARDDDGPLLFKVKFAQRVLADVELPSSATRVLTTLLLVSLNNTSGRCNPSYATLGRAAGLKRRQTVVDAVKALADRGWISVEAHPSQANKIGFCWDRQVNEGVRKAGGSENGEGTVSGEPGVPPKGVRFSAEGVRSPSAKSMPWQAKKAEPRKNPGKNQGSPPSGRRPAGAPGRMKSEDAGFRSLWETMKGGTT